MGYGVQIVFSDAHERGIYPWAYLRTLGAAPSA
ncbi:gamma-butyrobetaine hydroxylase-like domain-containing protein [Cupriavidus sp. 8B]